MSSRGLANYVRDGLLKDSSGREITLSGTAGAMDYVTISNMGLPIGSGAMESAIRRVVNLRLKGASLYWLRDTAEAMLMLRSYYKAGRWNMMKNLAFSVQLQNAA